MRADRLTVLQRSALMARIHGRDTKPELAVRRIVHRLGYRFRLHRRDLPGTPDLVFPRLRRVIFVHGCFWHLHSCQKGQTAPRVRAAFWKIKREGNAARDKRSIARLRKDGWRVLVIWECQLKRNLDRIKRKIAAFLH